MFNKPVSEIMQLYYFILKFISQIEWIQNSNNAKNYGNNWSSNIFNEIIVYLCVC